MRALANDTGCVVVAVNYQKAPEHKFPVPFNDAWASLVWVADHVEELNVDPARIAVGGDSAGGNLAAAVAIKARDEGGPALAYQLLIYPVVENSVDSPSAIQNAEGYLLQRALDALVLGPLRGRGDRHSRRPRVAPLRAKSHADLPPALIVTAEFDPLRDDGAATPQAAGGRGPGHLRQLRRHDPRLLLDAGRARPLPRPARTWRNSPRP